MKDAETHHACGAIVLLLRYNVGAGEAPQALLNSRRHTDFWFRGQAQVEEHVSSLRRRMTSLGDIQLTRQMKTLLINRWILALPFWIHYLILHHHYSRHQRNLSLPFFADPRNFEVSCL